MPINSFRGGLAEQASLLPASWASVLRQPSIQSQLVRLEQFLAARLAAGADIYPSQPFKALHLTPPDSVQVVILGQDPYHGPGQAHGLAFSVPDKCLTPPSLRNIFAELAREYPDSYAPQKNCLERWARQGVLLLNATLTVEAGKAGSHAGQGWERVTDALISHVLSTPAPKVFMLWGNHARAKKGLIRQFAQAGSVLVLECNHPSPLSARRPPLPFVGCGHFTKANSWLRAAGCSGIDWLAQEADQSVLF